MSLLRTNLVFGEQSHLIHFLTQCAIVGKCPYPSLIAKSASFNYSPVHTDDIASQLLNGSSGIQNLNGPERMNLRQIMNSLEVRAMKNEGQTSGPMVPVFDYMWDFFTGTTSDVNMSRMHAFYETHESLSEEMQANSVTLEDPVKFGNWVN